MRPRIARAALHLWEEPCVSAGGGSGTVFFSGCPLKCAYCQNSKISAEGFGKTVTSKRLREIFQELIELGAQNINLVTPTHFIRAIEEALCEQLPVPVVYNSAGYDSAAALRRLEGKIQVYMPDFKYADSALAARYSDAPDYPKAAKAAIEEMYAQVGAYELDGGGAIRRGLIIRHLILPGQLENTYRVIDWAAGRFPPGSVLFSLMSQYTPPTRAIGLDELDRTLTAEEYNKAIDRLFASGIEDGFFQELSSAGEEYLPEFDLTGVGK
jgi:putative pyruvate formate lyase activating enzyme